MHNYVCVLKACHDRRSTCLSLSSRLNLFCCCFCLTLTIFFPAPDSKFACHSCALTHLRSRNVAYRDHRPSHSEQWFQWVAVVVNDCTPCRDSSRIAADRCSLCWQRHPDPRHIVTLSTCIQSDPSSLIVIVCSLNIFQVRQARKKEKKKNETSVLLMQTHITGRRMRDHVYSACRQQDESRMCSEDKSQTPRFPLFADI